MDSSPITCKSLERFYHINGVQLERHYKEHLSNFRDWNQLERADKWLLFPENIGFNLSIDETKSEDVITVHKKIPEDALLSVKEVTLDMTESMRKIVGHSFPKAARVIDIFHVQKLALDAIQQIRIEHRWDAINNETDQKEEAKF